MKHTRVLSLVALFAVTALVSGCATTPPLVESYPEADAHRISVGGVETHYFDYFPDAPGRPVLFLHGYASSGFEAHFFKDALGSQRRLIAPDFPGAGLSEKPQVDYTVEYYVDFVEEFVRKLGIGEFDLIGHSMGGLITTTYVATRSPRIHRLVLIAPFGLDGSAGTFNELIARSGPLVDVGLELNNRRFMEMAMRMNSFDDASKLPPDLVDYLAYANFHTPNARGALASITHNIIASDPDPSLLERIATPTVIIWGEDDDVLSSRFAPRFHSLIPDSELHLIPDCGHMPHVEQSAVTAYIVREFLGPPAE